MQQVFVLKYHGGYSLFEQALMTAEERNWIVRRINEERKKENKQAQNTPSMPSIPHMPRIPGH